MKNKKDNLVLLNNSISGLVIIVLGLIVTIGNINLYTIIINLLVCVFLIYGLSSLINFILKRKIVRNKQILIRIILNIVLGIIMLIFPKIPLAILPLVFSLYLLINSIAKFINYVILKEINLIARFKDLFFCLIFLILSMTFLFYPVSHLDWFLAIIGIYCIILGLNRILEFITNILSDKFKLKIKKKLKISLPAFLEAFIPRRGLNIINKYIDDLILEDKKKEEISDLQIFIHLSKYGFNQFGHMDIMFEGNIYSYGNYDKDSRKLFTTLGDGVVFIVEDKHKYIDFCVKNNNKTIVEYGIKLTDYQKNKIKKEIDLIMKDSINWQPLISKNEVSDYTRKLYKATKAKFYKFEKGEYKTYFALGINCIYFANKIIKNCVDHILKLVGIISPGTYYEYLEENYKKKNSNVVSRKIYNKENIGGRSVKNKK